MNKLELPSAPIDRVLRPVERFLHVEAASGIVLLVCAALALVLANSPWAAGYLGFWNTEVGIEIGTFRTSHSLQHWINDGLMVIFFFVIGLEVKREIVLGELQDMRRAALPIAAALGGMIVPAGVYLALQAGGPAQDGWGIPMATDIAFVVGCMAVLGSRIPHGLRVLLLSLAIADDIGAILVIAVGYTEEIHLGALALGLLGIGVVGLLSRLGVRSFLMYTILGFAIWSAFLASGVHATIAGVILGLMTPARSSLSGTAFGRFLERASDVLGGGEWSETDARGAKVRRLQQAARESVSPLEYLESLLHPWVAFVVMPIFALANAGVPFAVADFAQPVALAVAAGLIIGKPLGILLFSFLAVRVGLARLPDRVGWGAVMGGGFLAGIGFTMALFIAGLALEGDQLNPAKVGILGASAVAAVLGMSALLILLPGPRAAESSR